MKISGPNPNHHKIYPALDFSTEKDNEEKRGRTAIASASVARERICFSPKRANTSYYLKFSHSSSRQFFRPLKLHRILRASFEAIYCNFATIEDPTFGPPALLLLGFQVDEVAIGEEMMMFIDAFPEAGLEDAVFAAVVPNSADKPLQEVIEEIMGDHKMVSTR